jgi:hypothetical protein
MSANVDKIRTDHEAATETYHQALDSLKTPDGRAVYSRDEEARRLQEIESTYRTAQQDAQRALQDVINQADAEIAASAVGDPLTRLSATQLEQAGQLRAFVSEDFERLPSTTLAEHCREALASADKARIALALRYGRQAMATRFASPGQGYELKGVLAELQEYFADTAKRSAAQATRDAAGPLVTSMATQRYLHQAYGHHDNRRRVA